MCDENLLGKTFKGTKMQTDDFRSRLLNQNKGIADWLFSEVAGRVNAGG